MKQKDLLAAAMWEADAHKYLRLFVRNAKRTRKSFLVEDVREYATGRGLPDDVVDQRKWGSVIKQASNDGLIVSIGTMKARSSNYSPKTLWAAA